jgi:hypothetical protein
MGTEAEHWLRIKPSELGLLVRNQAMYRHALLEANRQRHRQTKYTRDAISAYCDGENAALDALWELAQSVSCLVGEGPDVLKTQEVYKAVSMEATKALDFFKTVRPDWKPHADRVKGGA